MSVVEIVTKDGKHLGRIDDVTNEVEVSEEWEEIAGKKRRKKKSDKEKVNE